MPLNPEEVRKASDLLRRGRVLYGRVTDYDEKMEWLKEWADLKSHLSVTDSLLVKQVEQLAQQIHAGLY